MRFFLDGGEGEEGDAASGSCAEIRGGISGSAADSIRNAVSMGSEGYKVGLVGFWREGLRVMIEHRIRVWEHCLRSEFRHWERNHVLGCGRTSYYSHQEIWTVNKSGEL